MAAGKWSTIRNIFAQFEPVPPDKLADWFVTRRDSPVDRLAVLFSPEDNPGRYILVGQPASGKSSELTKLASELSSRYNALVVRFDMTDNADVERANPVEVIFMMGVAVFKVAADELPKDRQPDRTLLEALSSGLETLVHTHTENKQFSVDLEKLLTGLVVFGGAALAGPVGAAAGFAGAEAVRGFIGKIVPFRFSSGTNEDVVRKIEVEPQVEEMIDSLNSIIDDVRTKAKRPLVLIVDGLDKLRDRDVVSINFLEKKFLNGPKCNVLYTGPLDLYYSPEFGEVRARFPIVPFSHVKLRDRDDPGKPDKHGPKVLREVVRRRLESVKMELEDVFAGGALNALINGSGGVMRDFIRLVQASALQAEVANKDRIGKREAATALNELRRQFMAQITPEYQRVLDEVREKHRRVAGKECDLLLRNNIVLSYVNDDIWYDVHAALTDEPW